MLLGSFYMCSRWMWLHINRILESILSFAYDYLIKTCHIVMKQLNMLWKYYWDFWGMDFSNFSWILRTDFHIYFFDFFFADFMDTLWIFKLFAVLQIQIYIMIHKFVDWTFLSVNLYCLEFFGWANLRVRMGLWIFCSPLVTTLSLYHVSSYILLEFLGFIGLNWLIFVAFISIYSIPYQ